MAPFIIQDQFGASRGSLFPKPVGILTGTFLTLFTAIKNNPYIVFLKIMHVAIEKFGPILENNMLQK